MQETITRIAGLLFDAPLVNKPKPQHPGQTMADVIQNTARIFAATLIDIDDELLKTAVIHWIATEKWFPAPADLRGTASSLLCLMDDAPDSYTAWQQVKRSLGSRTPLHPLVKRAIDALGGIKEFGCSDIGDEPSWRARFIAAYEQFKKRTVDDAMMLPAVTQFIEGGGGRILNAVSAHQLMAETAAKLKEKS